MTRSLQEFLTAADGVIEDLLRTEVTPEDIAAALQRHCPDWTEADRESVMTLAGGVAYRISDIGFKSCALDFEQRMAYPVQYSFVWEQLQLRRAQTQPASFEDRCDSIIDRHFRYFLG